MFERNPVDTRAEVLLAVEITLADASKLAGRAVLAKGRAVHKLLEGDEAFLYVEGFDGEGTFVPKADIRGVKVINPGRPTGTHLSVPDARAFDPYRSLGLSRGATFADIREAYLRLSKLYHPDSYAGVTLPKEVQIYLESMAKAVNAAYVALKHVGDKQAPIYTRGG